MNLATLGRRIDGAIRSLSPGWAAARDKANMQAAQSRYLAAAYDSARQTQMRKPRSLVFRNEANVLTDQELSSMREWSCDTFRNCSIMSGIIRRSVDNIVGECVVLQPASSDAGYNAEVSAGFAEYTRKGGGWDVTNRWSLGQYQRAAVFDVWRAGDFLLYRADEGWQIFEGHQIGTPLRYNMATATITGGIETDDGGKPIRYWVADHSKLGYIDPTSARGIRADKCVHVVNLEWLSGMRGIPIFGNSLGRLEDFEAYLESTLVSAIARSCVVGEINSPSQNAGAALDVRPIGQQTQDDPNRPRPRQLAPGMILETRLQEKFTLHSANIQGGEFAEYVRLNLRLFGMQIGMPLELSVMDSSQTNFAAAKLSCMQAAKTQAFVRNSIVVNQATAPIYFDFLDAVFPRSKKRPADYRKFEIIAPESDWINALQESNALNAGVNGGWDSVTRIAREEMRRDIDSVLDDRASEIAKARQKAAKYELPEEYWHHILGGATATVATPDPASSTDSGNAT